MTTRFDMSTIFTVVFVIGLSLLYASVNSSSVPAPSDSHDWDILIFTQHWPITVCLEWKEVIPGHTCIFPPNKDRWTVHGIWPTKLGTIGPGYCNSSWHFNPKELVPIEDKLEQFWGNVHSGNRYDLWHHEWDKHGTCAAALPELASEVSYFGRGLTWINDYNMNDILGKSGILPDKSEYDAADLFSAVRNVLGKDPDIQCITNRKTGDVYLFEIRICFTKSLVLTDCDGVKSVINKSSVITNCPTGKVIIYPSKVPPQWESSAPRMPWLLDVLHYIQWLQWLTL